jgi:hypothetical protein
MAGMIKGVKANHIGVQHTLQNVFATLKFPENLGCWKGNVQKRTLRQLLAGSCVKYFGNNAK